MTKTVFHAVGEMPPEGYARVRGVYAPNGFSVCGRPIGKMDVSRVPRLTGTVVATKDASAVTCKRCAAAAG